jgi:3-oxoadipate enol-lactonase
VPDTMRPTATTPIAEPATAPARREMTALLGGPAPVLAQLRVRTPRLAAALETAFADVLAEPGLGRAEREIATLAALTALGGSPGELAVHADAALRVGVDRDELATLLHHLLPYVGFPRVLQAVQAVGGQLPTPAPEARVDLGDHATGVIDRPARGAARTAPMILIHALGLDRLMWRDTIAALPTDRRVVAYDLRGHGQATEAPHVRDLAHFAGDLGRLLDRLELPAAHLVGLSLGGAIAQTFALAHPDRVAALDLVATVARPQPAFLDRAQQALDAGMAGVLAATLTRWFTPDALAVNGWPVRYARDLVLRTATANWAASWRALAGVDTLHRLARLSMPVRVIAGELDPSTPPEVMQEIAAAVPGSRFSVIHGAPHMLSLERPAELARVLAG